MATAGTPKNRLKKQMPVNDSPKWSGYANKITQMAAGGIASRLTLQMGRNHGMTKSVIEIQNHHFPLVLNFVSFMSAITINLRLPSFLSIEFAV